MKLLSIEILLSIIENKGRCMFNTTTYRSNNTPCVCPFYDEAVPCSPFIVYTKAITMFSEYYPVEAYKYFLKRG